MTDTRVAPATYALAVATVAAGAANYSLGGLLPALANHLHLSTSIIGQLGTAFGLASATAALAVGMLTAHWPRRRVLTAGLTLVSLGNLMAMLAPGYAVLVAARITTGLGSAAAVTAALGQAAEINAPARRARAMAVAIGGLTIALAAAPPAATSLAAHHGPQIVFGALAVLAALALITARIVLPANDAVDQHTATLGDRLRVINRPGIRPTLAGKYLTASAAFMVQTYMATLVSPSAAVVQLAAYGVGAVVGTQLGGLFADRYTPRSATLVAIGAQALTFAVWPLLAHPAAVLAALAFVAAAAFWAAQPAFARQLADLADEQRAPALALDSTVIYLAQASGGLFGALLPTPSRGMLLPVVCLILSVAGLATVVLSGKNPLKIRVSRTLWTWGTDRTTGMARPALGRDDRVDVPVSPELKQKFKLYCAARGRSMTAVINDLIVAELREPEQKELEPIRKAG